MTRIEALNYRCLRYVTRSLSPMRMLAGPNGSGKTTFLDVLAFLGRLVSEGLESASGGAHPESAGSGLVAEARGGRAGLGGENSRAVRATPQAA